MLCIPCCACCTSCSHSAQTFSGAQPRDEARLWGSCCEVGGSKPSFTPSPASMGQGVFPVSQQVPQCHLEHRPTGVPSCPRESPQRPQDRNTLRGPSSLSVPRGGRVPSALGSRGQSPLRVLSARGGPEGKKLSAVPGADPSRRQRPEAGVPASRPTDPALRRSGEGGVGGGGPAWALHGPAPPLSAPFGLGWSCSRPFIPGLNLGCAQAAASRPPRPGRVSSAPCNWLEGARARVIRWGGRLAAPRRPPSRPAAPWR